MPALPFESSGVVNVPPLRFNVALDVGVAADDDGIVCHEPTVCDIELSRVAALAAMISVPACWPTASTTADAAVDLDLVIFRRLPADVPIGDLGVAIVRCAVETDRLRRRPGGDFVDVLFEIRVAVGVEVAVVIGGSLG